MVKSSYLKDTQLERLPHFSPATEEASPPSSLCSEILKVPPHPGALILPSVRILGGWVPPAIYSKKRQQERVGTKPEGGFSPSQPSQVWFACFLAGGAWRASEENEEGLSGQGSSCPSGLSLNPGNGQLKCFNVIKQSPAQRQQAADKSEDG